MESDSIWLEHLNGGRIAYYEANGLRTRALEAGDKGPAVVFLHGIGGHAEAFIRNVVPIAERGFRTYAIDMLGHGYTDKPDCGYHINDYVEHLKGVLTAVSNREPVFVVGESRGGWVAMRAAVAYPEMLAGVVSVVGGGLRPAPPTAGERKGWSELRSKSASALDDMSWENWRARMDWLVLDPASMPDEMVRVRMKIYSNPRMREAAREIYKTGGGLGGEFSQPLSPEELTGIKVPVFYLWTDANPTTPVEIAQAAAALTPNSKLAVMENCGHWPQYEDAPRFNELLADFLNGCA